MSPAVRRIASTYEVRGMRKALTSYDNATVGSGSIVNDNKFVYNDFSQLTTEYQSHSGAVIMSTTAKVQYGYATGSGNTIRATNLVYPSGRVLTYAYGSTGSQADRLSRVASYIDDDGTSHIVDYSYVGTTSFVEGDRPQPQMKWTLVDLSGTNDPDTGDIYTGLDRFGHVKDNRWYGYGTSTDLDRIQYGYDRAGNRTWRRNTVAAALSKEFDEIYTYDGVHRLKDMARGLLNSNRTALTSTTFAQCWTLDATGNWSGFREDDTGNGTWDLVQARSANPVNEIGTITNSVGAAWVQPAYSLAGNMTTMPQPNDPTKGYTATYDAWNRLVKIVDTPTSNTVSEYAYDGARRQIRQKNYESGTLTETRHLYYTDPASWRCLEERLGPTPDSAAPDRQFVWGERYIDDLILRDRAVAPLSSSSSGGSGPNPLGERVLATQDANWNVTALFNSSATPQERFAYSAYGTPKYFTSAFTTRLASAFAWDFLYCGYRYARPALYNVRYRTYHSTIGSWIQRDPLPQMISKPSLQFPLLSYAASNPLVYLDAIGLAPTTPADGCYATHGVTFPLSRFTVAPPIIGECGESQVSGIPSVTTYRVGQCNRQSEFNSFLHQRLLDASQKMISCHRTKGCSDGNICCFDKSTEYETSFDAVVTAVFESSNTRGCYEILLIEWKVNIKYVVGECMSPDDCCILPELGKDDDYGKKILDDLFNM